MYVKIYAVVFSSGGCEKTRFIETNKTLDIDGVKEFLAQQGVVADEIIQCVIVNSTRVICH